MRKLLLYVFLFLIGTTVFAQKQEDLLKEFNTLKIKLRDTSINSETIKTLAKDYLKKAKKSGEKRFIGRGYYLFTIRNTDKKEKLQYLDSTIYATKDVKSDPVFPVQAYMFKGFLLSGSNDYEQALDYFVLAESVAKFKNDLSSQYYIKYNIALLKRFLGEYKEAEALFLECKQHEKSSKDINQKSYLKTLFQLSSIYYETAQVEKCSLINVEGIQLAKTLGDEKKYYSFVVNEGINLNVKGEYQASIDSLEKGYQYLPTSDQQVADFYLGRSYFLLGEKEKGLNYFKKVDTTFNQTNDLYPPLIGAYEYLINDSKRRNDKESQLYYTNQLLKIDSILDKNYKYLLNTIVKKYDIPRYVSERDDTIEELRKENEQVVEDKKHTILISILISVLALGGLLYYYRLKKVYEKRYNAVMKSSKAIIEEEITVKDTNLKPILAVGIDEDIVEDVLKNLQIFEKGEAYLTKQISLKDVAKIVKTNSKYLSKIINVYKDKNFATYINDLRIDYLVNHIQHNTKYQKYTIRATAEEIGFTNSESFSRAFQKKIGLKPSYFIKKVRESEQKNP
ncbi:helix-turn-helix domain-containing protein [uncultured Kordia sp.]|uniref:helix-turn-helix domain-containing protein n=1 Tax=uncultured Kordia sp. TaxID=507699 RepID=UPI002609E37B|nr:helix-turn-helix domain-containing protein [uncultured Kordia sp.]